MYIYLNILQNYAEPSLASIVLQASRAFLAALRVGRLFGLGSAIEIFSAALFCVSLPDPKNGISEETCLLTFSREEPFQTSTSVTSPNEFSVVFSTIAIG